MAKKPVRIENQIEDETELAEDDINTPAGQSIVAKPVSKSAMMATAVSAMSQMTPDQMSDVLDQVLAQIGHEADGVPDDTADRNRASVSMKGAMKEDVLEIFGTENLSEEFKFKIETLFESAVESRVAIELGQIEEEAEAVVEQNVSESIEELIEKTDKYLSYVAEKWLEENEVAIDKTLKSEISEEFMSGLKALFAEHAIEIPEASIDVVEELTATVDGLEEKYNASLNDNITLLERIETLEKNAVFNEISEGLAMSQVEKLKQLTEGIEYNSDTYADKIQIIKEQYFNKDTRAKPKTTPFLIEEENDYSDEKPQFNSPGMENFANAIKRTVKK